MSKTTTELQTYFSDLLEKEKQCYILSTAYEELMKLPDIIYTKSRISSMRELKLEASIELTKLYGQNICDEKYRNFSAVASITQYLYSGLCESLEGENGAYAMYDKAVEDGLIITEIIDYNTVLGNDDILYKLETNQPYLLKCLYESTTPIKKYIKAHAIIMQDRPCEHFAKLIKRRRERKKLNSH